MVHLSPKMSSVDANMKTIQCNTVIVYTTYLQVNSFLAENSLTANIKNIYL